MFCGSLLCYTATVLLNQERVGKIKKDITSHNGTTSFKLFSAQDIGGSGDIVSPSTKVTVDSGDISTSTKGAIYGGDISTSTQHAVNIGAPHSTNSPVVDVKHSKYQPMKDIAYNKSGSHNNDRSIFVAPRRAFYDTRFYKGKEKPLNEVVVLAEVHDYATKSIVACEINGALSQSVQIVSEDVGWIRSHKKGYTHHYLLIWCSGFPKEAIVNNSVVRIIYKKRAEDFYSRVEVEMPLYLANHTDKDTLTFDRGKGSVVVCSALYGHPPMFDQWLKYQQTLNIDMVHLNVDTSFYNNATQVYPFLKESLETGFVQMHEWKNIVNDRNFYKSQLVKSNDCLYRYIGVFEYAFFIDMDDFITFRTARHKDIHFFLEKYFLDSQIAAVHFWWMQMKCKPIPEKIKTLPDGNLTSILSGNSSDWRVEAKCAYRLNGVKAVLVHQEQKLLPGFRSERGNREYVYVAHLRDTAVLCN